MPSGFAHAALLTSALGRDVTHYASGRRRRSTKLLQRAIDDAARRASAARAAARHLPHRHAALAER